MERRAERLSRNIERTVEASIEGAMRAVEGALGHLDRQQGYDSRQSATRIDTTFAFSADGTVDLTSFNGDITVTGWNRKEARCPGEHRARDAPVALYFDADQRRGRHLSRSHRRDRIRSHGARGRAGGLRADGASPCVA
jgi:hypothetical protein